MRRRLLASLLELSSLSSPSSNNTAAIQMRAAGQPQQQRATTSASASVAAAAASASSTTSPPRRRMPPPSQSRLSPLLRSLSLSPVSGRVSDSRGQLSAPSRGLFSAERLLSTRAASSSAAATLLAAEDNSHADAPSAPPSPSPPAFTPNPAFTALGLPDDVCSALAAMGIMEPTEIQVRWSFTFFSLDFRKRRRATRTERKKRQLTSPLSSSLSLYNRPPRSRQSSPAARTSSSHRTRAPGRRSRT